MYNYYNYAININFVQKVTSNQKLIDKQLYRCISIAQKLPIMLQDTYNVTHTHTHTHMHASNYTVTSHLQRFGL